MKIDSEKEEYNFTKMELEKSEYAVTPFKLNEMPKINEISHFAHIDYQAFAINDCAACF